MVCFDSSCMRRYTNTDTYSNTYSNTDTYPNTYSDTDTYPNTYTDTSWSICLQSLQRHHRQQ